MRMRREKDAVGRSRKRAITHLNANDARCISDCAKKKCTGRAAMSRGLESLSDGNSSSDAALELGQGAKSILLAT